ncbi:ATP-binding protein [Pelagicoccus sp. NFK12]|uniref:ATP-binding protein n=1 Tax=Pelagicoccus enzymogenes TaxID=2773457 RepID=A0A927FFU4_9BACT|nr:ATP-binding protein [Pelagicoccus enzymogenes]MBD5782613.1 ATP-binding protein [Pelagicoccus enzymogenes]
MPRTNTLYLVTGMPAAGKSTFARKLAARTGACLLDIDTCTETIVQAAMERISGEPNDRDSPTFKETFREPVYDTLFAIAAENLPHTDVIVTGPFTKEQARPHWPREIRSRLGAPCDVKCVFVHCSPELRKRRLIERANPRDEPKLKNWEKHLQYYDPDAFPAYPHFAVDTAAPKSFETALNEGLLD